MKPQLTRDADLRAARPEQAELLHRGILPEEVGDYQGWMDARGLIGCNALLSTGRYSLLSEI